MVDSLQAYESFNINHPYKEKVIISECIYHGSYCDKKTIKCRGCSFEVKFDEEDNLKNYANLHYRASRICKYSQKATEFIDYNKNSNEEAQSIASLAEESGILSVQCSGSRDQMELDEANTADSRTGTNSGLSLSSSSSSINKKSKKTKNSMTNLENRIKSYENVKMLYKPEDLADNGLFNARHQNENEEIVLNSKSELINESSVAYLARVVPALIHVKCCFCSFETLLLEKSLYNNEYNLPFDDHKKHSETKEPCPIYTVDSLSTGTLNQISKNNLSRKIPWLQILLDSSSLEDSKHAWDIFVKLNDISFDDVTVKQTPKIIDSLIIYEMTKDNIEVDENSSQKSANMHYSPGSSEHNEYTKIQSILSTSKNVIMEKAKHPQFSTPQARLESFKDWPATMSQRPDELSRAGFYYYGIKDMVKCFFCNGGLKNWDQNDDPFEDHVRWFPQCQFIRQLMGREYVEQIRLKYENADSGFDNLDTFKNQMLNENKDASTIVVGASVSDGNKKAKRSVSPRTLNSRLDTQIVRRLIDQKILLRESIKYSFEHKLSDTNDPAVYGDDYKTPLEMAKIAIEFDFLKRSRIEGLQDLSDILIAHLPNIVRKQNIYDLFDVKYGIFPKSVKILREDGSHRCFCLITLYDKHKDSAQEVNLDTIVQELNGKHYPGLNHNEEVEPLLVIKTNWLSLEKLVSSLVSKPSVVSTSSVPVAKKPQPQNSTLVAQTPITSTTTTATNKPAKDETKESSKNLNQIPSIDETEESVLREENERLKSLRLCAICLTKDKNVLFLPCAHLASCFDCSLALQNCPICRTKIQATVRTFT